MSPPFYAYHVPGQGHFVAKETDGVDGGALEVCRCAETDVGRAVARRIAVLMNNQNQGEAPLLALAEAFEILAECSAEADDPLSGADYVQEMSLWADRHAGLCPAHLCRPCGIVPPGAA